jgi:ribosomal protein S18 acetylase RimI-like enzyme
MVYSRISPGNPVGQPTSQGFIMSAFNNILMDWPENFVTRKDINRLEEEEGCVIVPFGVGKEPSKTGGFAAIVYQADADSVSGWYFSPHEERWVEENRIDAEKVKTINKDPFRSDIFVFGEPGRATEEMHKSIGSKLKRMIGSPPFMFDESSAAELQDHGLAGNCTCTQNSSEKLGGLSVPVENGDDIQYIGCTDCGMPYFVGSPPSPTPVDVIFKHEWIFSETEPNSIESSTESTLYYVNPPTDSRIHFGIGLLIGEATSETLLAQDYNVESDEFLLASDGSEVVGLLSWNFEWETPTLTQLYIRPDSRGHDIAKELIRAWCDYIDADHVYADHFNEASRGLFDSLGLFEDGEHDMTVQEYFDVYPQQRQMDANFYDTFPKSAYPDEMGLR